MPTSVSPRKPRPDSPLSRPPEGLSLRAYLARLAETLLTPGERAERAGEGPGRAEGNNYAPTTAEEQDLDNELDRRLAQVTGQ